MSTIRERLAQVFSVYPRLNVVMMGDFFIDQYLQLERALSEVSLETGLEAFQVTAVRNSLGAAGTVANNLCAMGVRVTALTLRGQDANGYVMDRLMQDQSILAAHVVVHDTLCTPTYAKPMMLEMDGSWHELNRMDIKNRQHIPVEIETALIDHLAQVLPWADCILITDQVQEEGCGVLTPGVREAIHMASIQYPQLSMWVDSRERGALFRGLSLKTNLSEAKKALKMADHVMVKPLDAARALFQRNGKPVLITAGEEGIAYCGWEGSGMVPALQMEGELDIVGAGDSVLAGAGTAIAAGATLREAALIGCLAASVTIKKIGTTGTASAEEMQKNLSIFEAQNPDFYL